MDIFPGATLLQVEEWGYFMGSLRPAPDPDLAFSVIHITGNSRLPSAENEAGWRISDPGLQNSATFFNNRDGSCVQLLGDPLTMDPWANGDVQNPDLSNPRIARLVRDGVNANERTVLAIENVGFEPGASVTPQQEETCARQIARYHTAGRVPINRETVIGHYQLNSVGRPNCPAVDKSIVDRIVAKAQAIAPEEDPMYEWHGSVVTQLPKIITLRPGNRTLAHPEDTPYVVKYTSEKVLVGSISGFWVYLGEPGGLRLVPKGDVAAADISRALSVPTDAEARMAAATAHIEQSAAELAAGLNALRGAT